MLAGHTLTDVTINGTPRALPVGTTVHDLVATLGLQGKRIAVERNGDIVPRSRYGDTRIAPGDRIEIVGAVGGG